MSLIYIFMIVGILGAEFGLYKASKATGIKTVPKDIIIIGAGGLLIGLVIGFLFVSILLFF